MRFASVIPHVSLYPFQISDQTTPTIHGISRNESQFFRNDLTSQDETHDADEVWPTSEGKVQPTVSKMTDTMNLSNKSALLSLHGIKTHTHNKKLTASSFIKQQEPEKTLFHSCEWFLCCEIRSADCHIVSRSPACHPGSASGTNTQQRKVVCMRGPAQTSPPPLSK